VSSRQGCPLNSHGVLQASPRTIFITWPGTWLGMKNLSGIFFELKLYAPSAVASHRMARAIEIVLV